MTACREKKRRHGIARGLLLALLILAAAVVYLERNLSQVVLSMANATARSLAVNVLNDACDELVGGGMSYEELMKVTRDDTGQVRLIQANATEMNRLAAKASMIAQTHLESIDNQYVNIPLGSALGLTLLAGSGPRIRVQILPVGAVSTRFDTEFESAGINQTRHKILLTLKAVVRLVIPTGSATIEAQTQVAVAESIIVGAVPDSFVDVNNDSDMLNLIP